MKKITHLSLILFIALFTSCNSGNPELKNAEEIKDRSEQQKVTGDKPVETLRANAISEGDIEGQIKWSLGRLQEELRASVGKVKELGEVSVLLDDNLQMVIRNKFDGNVYEKRVGVANLNTDMSKLQIIVDNGNVLNPGFKMPVLDGKPGVEIFVNGEKKETVKELEIFLGERRQVQLVISALTQAAQTAQGK